VRKGAEVIQQKRSRAVSQLVERIERGEVVPLDLQEEVRFVVRESETLADPKHCAICRIPLVGRQEGFCVGHWDYVIVDIPVRDPYIVLLRDVAVWLRENLVDPAIVRTHDWRGATTGHLRCELCDRPSPIIERLQNHHRKIVKQHVVCHDHASFRTINEDMH
jgi:hypothetical protein